jgi:hypothetical protein
MVCEKVAGDVHASGSSTDSDWSKRTRSVGPSAPFATSSDQGAGAQALGAAVVGLKVPNGKSHFAHWVPAQRHCLPICSNEASHALPHPSVCAEVAQQAAPSP